MGSKRLQDFVKQSKETRESAIDYIEKKTGGKVIKFEEDAYETIAVLSFDHMEDTDDE